MKNALLLVLTATSLALAALCVVQWQKLSGQKTQIVSLRSEMEQRTQEITDLQASQKLVEQQRLELLGQASDLAAKLQTRQQSGAKIPEATAPGGVSIAEDQKPEKDKNSFGNFLAKLMEDPDTKKMIREQQRMMLDQLYGPLVKQLNLTPEDAARFKDLLADNMMKGAEKATSLLGGGSTTNRTERLGKLAEEQKSFDEQVRGFLGETGYAQYQDYQLTVGERTQLSQFQQQNAGSGNALTDQQTERLLALMKEEKQNAAAATGQPLPGAGQDTAAMEAMFSGDGAEKLLQSQEAINQRVYERAKEVLSENQLTSFRKFQTNQLQMMRMGMTMAKKFMAPENTEGAPPTPNP
jgi:hypothetical protein